MLQIALVILVILFLILSLYRNWFKPTISFLLAIVFLLATRIITPQEALIGFANEQLAVIVLLLIIGGIFQKTGILNQILSGVFNTQLSSKQFLLRMMSSVGLSSAFFNNTPLVAIMMPYVYHWSKEQKKAPSKFLIPLSFASILGGCVTLIGTSTNLIVNGLAMEQGVDSLGIFDFTIIGLAMLLIGILYLYFFSAKLLPDNHHAMDHLVDNSREFFIETNIQPTSPLIGKTVEEAKLRNLSGLYLVQIIRGKREIKPVSPEEKLQMNDILLFGGVTDSLDEITNPKLGLSLPKACEFLIKDKTDVLEVIISQNSKLAGKTVKQSDFRGKYDGAILGVHRNGERLWGQIGEIVLRPGDVLLVLAGKDFTKRVVNNPHFYVLSIVKKQEKVASAKVIFLFGGLLCSILLATFNLVPLFISLLFLLIITVLSKIANSSEIRNSIDFDLVLIIGLGLALGKAMINSGATKLIAEQVLLLSPYIGIVGVLALIFIVTNLLASFITSKAAVAILLPIAITLAETYHLSPKAFILIVAFGGAANFITPMGYQTNLMVYGSGGYTFKDFFKIGWPLTLLYMLISVFLLKWIYNL